MTTLKSSIARSSIMLCVFVVLSALLLGAVYLRPFQTTLDIGADDRYIPGLHGPARNDLFTFAYSDGSASLRFPAVGYGNYSVEMRIGGPLGSIPVATSLLVEPQRLNFGFVDTIRVYHVLVPADSQANVAPGVESAAVTLPPDVRQLGVLVDWVAIRSLGPSTPPLSVLLTTALVLGLLCALLAQRAQSPWMTAAWLLAASLLICGSYAFFRGKLPIHGPWIAACLVACLVLVLWRLDTWRFPPLPSRLLSRFARTPLRRIISLFVVWRLMLWLVAAFGLWYSARLSAMAEHISGQLGPAEFSSFWSRVFAVGWFQWDSVHYRSIAIDGYAFGGQAWPTIAFFPLYPLLIRLLLPLTGGSVLIAGLVISHLALLAALWLLYDLVAHDFGSDVAHRTVLLLLLFPTSMFFVAVYSEALALALVVASIWAMRRQRWWLAGAAGCLLALTRIPGTLIAPALVGTYFACYRWRWRSISPSLLAALLPLGGLLLFILFQWWRFGTPLAFLQAQEQWNMRISPPWVMLWELQRSIVYSKQWPLAVFQAAVWITVLVLTGLSLRRLPVAYWLTGLLLVVPAYASSRPGSFPRYVLIAFPFIVVLALYAEKLWIRRLVIAVTLPLLVVATVLFVNGYWVA